MEIFFGIVVLSFVVGYAESTNAALQSQFGGTFSATYAGILLVPLAFLAIVFLSAFTRDRKKKGKA